MPTCKKCSQVFPNHIIIGEKNRNVSRRHYCLDCSPFGLHNTRQIHLLPKRRHKYNHAHDYQTDLRRNKKKKLVELLGGGCYICGYNRVMKALDFHHLNAEDKEFNISSTFLTQKAWDTILLELVKTMCVCRNCHAEIHEGLHAEKIAEWTAYIDIHKEEILNVGRSMFARPIKTLFTRGCAYCGKVFTTSEEQTKFCSTDCGHKSQRKVQRPSEEQLKDLLTKHSYCAVARMWGVSDNTIRKWLKTSK